MEAAVITVSDKGAAGERIDTAGPAVCALLMANGYEIAMTVLVPDERLAIQGALLDAVREDIGLILTVGGTGLSPRDVTPEASRAVIEREVPGIPELMRAESMKITPNGCLSRGICGTCAQSLIVNLPGSKKAATENLSFALKPLVHGLKMLRDANKGDCAAPTGKIYALCTSLDTGCAKAATDKVTLRANVGIVGDAHADGSNRQLSLLAAESIRDDEPDAAPGTFSENILTEGIDLRALKIGTTLRIGSALCEVSYIPENSTSRCVMTQKGIFARVLEDGFANVGDAVSVL